MERAVGTQYFPCISRPYGTIGGRNASLSTNMMSQKGQATICNAPKNSPAIQHKLWVRGRPVRILKSGRDVRVPRESIQKNFSISKKILYFAVSN